MRMKLKNKKENTYEADMQCTFINGFSLQHTEF